VFVLASAPRNGWQEQFGFALVEAMAAGLPAVVGDSGSLPEVIGDASQLVTPNQPTALAAALEALEERFDRRAVGRTIHGFFERALAEPPRS
jgi:glycosyltransferase involved in cell wall biosynthesis